MQPNAVLVLNTSAICSQCKSTALTLRLI